MGNGPSLNLKNDIEEFKSLLYSNASQFLLEQRQFMTFQFRTKMAPQTPSR
jgi:hypothetical protein